MAPGGAAMAFWTWNENKRKAGRTREGGNCEQPDLRASLHDEKPMGTIS